MEFSNGLCMGCMSEIGDEQICRICGYDNSAHDNGAGLPVRTVLGERYLVGRVLDSGGEGITYIGKDLQEGKTVRIREFFPTSICERNPDGSVHVEKEKAFSYNESLICFIELAKSLSSIGPNQNLLEVTDIFEAGNTAYYITENISGITLREFLLRNGGQLTWEQARSLFLPLMPTLSLLHENNIIHRGLSPETLLVGRDGKIRITGFCIAAARTARSDISARLFPGFAAIEQYGFDAQPGPWTDVYGLAATIYRTLIGNPPPEATERVTHDNMTIPAKLAESIPKSVLTSLAGALQITPENRTKSIEEFKEGLMAEGKVAAAAVTDKKEANTNTFFKQYGVLIIAGAAALLLLIIAIIVGKNWSSLFGGTALGGSKISVPTSSELIYNNENEVAKAIDFKGMTCAEVTEYYEKLGFTGIEVEVVSKEYNDEYKRGEIYKQEQKFDSELKIDETVKVYVSLGPSQVELPDFVKDETSYTEARLKLLEMGFLPDNIMEVAVTKLGEDTDKIFKMSPDAGTKVSVESRVELSYYKEIEDIEVKNFVGLNYYTEIKNNKDYSAYQFDIEETYSEVYEKGIVIRQSIPKGTKINNTEKITLVISAGDPPVMPDLTNRLKSDAVNFLSKNNISYTVIEQYSDSIAEGRVIKTNPSAGTTVGSTVTLYISKGAKPIPSSSPAESSSQASTPSVSSSAPSSSAVSSTVSETTSTVSSATDSTENAPSSTVSE